MDEEARGRLLKSSDLPTRADFSIGDLRVSPSRRTVEGPAGQHHVEPQFMLVFLHLLEAEGRVVTRQELFRLCWGEVIVGDDSLNRVIAGVRQMACAVGSTAIELENIPRTGYLLRRRSDQIELNCADNQLQESIASAFDCWRLGLPVADLDAIATLDRALKYDPNSARGWGMKACCYVRRSNMRGLINALNCSSFAKLQFAAPC